MFASRRKLRELEENLGILLQVVKQQSENTTMLIEGIEALNRRVGALEKDRING